MAAQILRWAQGWGSALVFYPLAERHEKRDVRSKLRELRHHYALPFSMRQRLALTHLVQTLEFAGSHVPYYQDLFKSIRFEPTKVERDPGYLQELPFLTKDIIREQGARLLSKRLEDVRHYACKTGGSTGAACIVYYDQESVDYSSAVLLFARESIGKKKHMFELHFASRFPETFPTRDRIREHFKCLAMNRSNIFFDRLDDAGLEEIWGTLRRRRPYLVHAHPSTIYALACYVEQRYGDASAFDVFESSGELLQLYMREAIARALRCRVVDRYGLAEFGIIAYQLRGDAAELQVLESEGWAESYSNQGSHGDESELVFTGFRNRLMPLIRYRTGDLARAELHTDGQFLNYMVGRMHDLVAINGVTYPTHYVQDLLGRVGGVQEFQIDMRETPPLLAIVPEPSANREEIERRLAGWWRDGLTVRFVGHEDLVRVGNRAKFRHVVQAT